MRTGRWIDDRLVPTQEIMCYVVMKVPNDILGLSFGPVVVLSGRPQLRPTMFFCMAIPTPEGMSVMLVLLVHAFLLHQSQ